MKKYFKLFVLALTITLGACSSDDNTPTNNNTDRILTMELTPQFQSLEDFSYMEVQLAVEAKEGMDVIVSTNNVEKEIYYEEGSPIITFILTFRELSEVVEIKTNQVVKAPATVITVSANKQMPEKTLVYSFKSWGDEELNQNTDLYMMQYESIGIFTPIVNWNIM